MYSISLKGLKALLAPLLLTFGEEEVTNRLEDYMELAEREPTPQSGRRRLFELLSGYVALLVNTANLDNRPLLTP